MESEKLTLNALRIQGTKLMTPPSAPIQEIQAQLLIWIGNILDFINSHINEPPHHRFQDISEDLFSRFDEVFVIDQNPQDGERLHLTPAEIFEVVKNISTSLNLLSQKKKVENPDEGKEVQYKEIFNEILTRCREIDLSQQALEAFIFENLPPSEKRSKRFGGQYQIPPWRKIEFFLQKNWDEKQKVIFPALRNKYPKDNYKSRIMKIIEEVVKAKI